MSDEIEINNCCYCNCEISIHSQSCGYCSRQISLGLMEPIFYNYKEDDEPPRKKQKIDNLEPLRNDVKQDNKQD